MRGRMEHTARFDVIPAIDVMSGSAVRLTGGDYSTAKVYFKDAGDAASYWQNSGAVRLHVVDLDGAKAGKTVNCKALERIRSRFGGKVDFSGGIRGLSGAKRAFELGADYIALGTALLDGDDAMLVAEGFPGMVIASADLKHGDAMLEGWTKGSGASAASLAGRIAALGIGTAIVTDVSRDGKLQGASSDYCAPFLERGLDAIVSGGVGSLEDVRRMAAEAVRGGYHGRITGVIVGKALYEGAFGYQEAVRAAAAAADGILGVRGADEDA